MKRESRTVDRSHQVDSSTQRHLPLVDLLVDTRAELMELAVASGLKVLATMLEADRTAICGPRYQHQDERDASRAGTVPSEVVLGGRKVQIRGPRVRAHGEEVALPAFQAFADTDPLNRRARLSADRRRDGPTSFCTISRGDWTIAIRALRQASAKGWRKRSRCRRSACPIVCANRSRPPMRSKA
jgi:hypothetical protein